MLPRSVCPKIKKITRIFFHKKIIPYRLIDEYTTIVGVKKMLIISIKGKNGWIFENFREWTNL